MKIVKKRRRRIQQMTVKEGVRDVTHYFRRPLPMTPAIFQ